jgi:GAF domain-containing protein
VSEELQDEPAEEVEEFVVQLRSLAGQELGSLAMTPPRGRHLTPRDKEIIAHVAEMTSAAIERAGAYSVRVDTREKE